MEAIKLCRLDTPIIFIEARINLSRFVVTGCAAKTSATVTFPSLNLRSEERRVGKECRSRWSPEQEKKKIEIRRFRRGSKECNCEGNETGRHTERYMIETIIPSPIA